MQKTRFGRIGAEISLLVPEGIMDTADLRLSAEEMNRLDVC